MNAESDNDSLDESTTIGANKLIISAPNLGRQQR